MRRILVARIALTIVGVAIWGYGNSTEQSPYIYAGMAVVGISLVLRFLPKHWFDDSRQEPHDSG